MIVNSHMIVPLYHLLSASGSAICEICGLIRPSFFGMFGAPGRPCRRCVSAPPWLQVRALRQALSCIVVLTPPYENQENVSDHQEAMVFCAPVEKPGILRG